MRTNRHVAASSYLRGTQSKGRQCSSSLWHRLVLYNFAAEKHQALTLINLANLYQHQTVLAFSSCHHVKSTAANDAGRAG